MANIGDLNRLGLTTPISLRQERRNVGFSSRLHDEKMYILLFSRGTARDI